MVYYTPKKEALISALAVFLVTITCDAMMTWVARDGMIEGIRGDLVDTANTAALFIDGDLHQTLIHPEQQGSAEYLKILGNFRKFIKGNPDIRFVYTKVMRDDKIYFVIDSQFGEDADKNSTDPNLTRNTPAAIMEEYKDATPAMKKALKEHVAVAESAPYSDEWGTFFSAYAPFYNSKNEFLGTVGVDINISDFQRLMMKVWGGFIAGIALSFLLSCVVYVLILRIRQEHARVRDLRQKRMLLMQDFHTQIQKISQEITGAGQRLNEMSGSIMTMTLESSGYAHDASEVIRGASGRIHSIALVCNQLVSTFDNLEKQSHDAQRIVTEAVGQLKLTEVASQHLSTAANNISNIINMITEITEKIDLLALNATIEAARAGEVGKGFAVVADEVKILSQQTGDATHKINEYVAEMQQATQIVVQAFHGITEKIIGVNDQAGDSLSAILNQKELIVAISSDVSGVTDSTIKIESVVNSVASIATNTEMQTQQLYLAIHSLSQQNQELNRNVSEFLTNINQAAPNFNKDKRSS